MNIIESMLSNYDINSKDSVRHALREVFQEITLSGLCAGGFFDHAAFYGGTCLRIFYDLPRFSEDLDFSLLKKHENFNIEKYFDSIIKEFDMLGIKISLNKKHKQNFTKVESAFLKNDTTIYDICIDAEKFQKEQGSETIKIKMEVDTNPPLYFETETKTLLMPKSFNVRAMTLPNLYAGKMHALLFRKWKNRVKGRDWFDFEWYVKKKVPLNLTHLYHRIKDSGSVELTKECLTKDDVKNILLERIEKVDFKEALEETERFVKSPEELKIWNKDYFRILADRIVYQQEQSATK